MALKIRLRQQGRKNHTVYRLVLTDSRSPRDGKHLEVLGWYNPYGQEMDKKLSVKSERVQFWLDRGAILSERVVSLLKQGSPEVIEAYKTKVEAHAVKMRDKRKEIRREKSKEEKPKAAKAEKAKEVTPKEAKPKVTKPKAAKTKE